ncbi:MAG: type I-F CRISPR-associated endoribonuclease Cas6/Csy4 [Ostreibacterium sp.]
MTHYIDTTLLPDPEFPATVLLNSLYTKLHKILFDLKSTDIGVSFPCYQITLGNVLRLHGEASSLQRLQQTKWLGGMSGYCQVGEITPIPSNCKYRTVSRIQITMSQSKLNRLLKRGSITQDEAKQYRAKMFSRGLDNPYLELQSGSNGHKHRRYIEFGELLDAPVTGTFDRFGLSRTATVPWF